MSVSFTPIDVRVSDRGEFMRFLSRDRFPFHVIALPSEEQVLADIDSGRYDGTEHAAFWVEHEEHGRIGIAVLEDLEDATPMFDLRLASRYRGRGLGAEILTALTSLLFERYPNATRFEGQTREDNIAMRKTFLRAGFVKEAHYRDGWPVEGGEALASVAYAILRRDWASGSTTTFDWEDMLA